MADIVIVGPPVVKAIEQGLASAGPGSRVVLFSSPESGTKLGIDPCDLYYNEISLASSYSCGPYETRRALGLIAAGAIPVQSLVTHRYPFDEVATAHAMMRQGGSALKAVVFFD